MNLMPFTEAFIMEVQRLASVLPICPPRLVTSDITVCGRLLKKGVQVQMNLYALHRNEEHWGPDVLDFRPERFWDNSGCVKQDEWLQPFGYGNFFFMSDWLLTPPVFDLFSQWTTFVHSSFHSGWKSPKKSHVKIFSVDWNNFHVMFHWKQFFMWFCFRWNALIFCAKIQTRY